MDFGILPPEITSALIHSGPGAWSLIEAAAVWQELSIELEQTLSGYTAELSSLTDTWRGPSATAMAQAAEPYLAWLRNTAQQCQQIASSVEVVTAAFELTHWTVVHPSVVAANRARLAMLLATNFFGINFPAIAQTEAEYSAMWVNNSAAMYRYAATSASATRLPQFSSPPPVANPGGVAVQANVVPATTTGGSAARTASAISLAAPTPTQFNPNKGWPGFFSTWGNQFIAGGFPINMLSYIAQTTSAQALQGIGNDIGQGLSVGGAALSAAEARLAGALSAAGSALAPRAALGAGVLVGKLSMPPAVVGMLPGAQAPVQLASAVSPLPSGASQLPGIPMAPMVPPQALRGSRRREGRDYDDIEYGAELPGTVMKRPPSAG
ncbi:MAG TPA: PPE family protein [Mycobacterium sp.]|nr:PPE family protein [Mycobacterium sp.]HTX95694.1 PPE family protein [Mycobacterium sp.]